MNAGWLSQWKAARRMGAEQRRSAAMSAGSRRERMTSGSRTAKLPRAASRTSGKAPAGASPAMPTSPAPTAEVVSIQRGRKDSASTPPVRSAATTLERSAGTVADQLEYTATLLADTGKILSDDGHDGLAFEVFQISGRVFDAADRARIR